MRPSPDACPDITFAGQAAAVIAWVILGASVYSLWLSHSGPTPLTGRRGGNLSFVMSNDYSGSGGSGGCGLVRPCTRARVSPFIVPRDPSVLLSLSTIFSTCINSVFTNSNRGRGPL
eukprot:RCo026527